MENGESILDGLINEWRGAFQEDRNSLEKQAGYLRDDYLVARVLNNRLIEWQKQQQAGHEHGDSLHLFSCSTWLDMIIRWTMNSILVSLRSLAGKQVEEKHRPRKGIISVLSILDDMKDNWTLYTFDKVMECVSLAHIDNGSPMSPYGTQQSVEDWSMLMVADSETGVQVINRKVFDYFTEQIENTTKEAATYVNKYIAHAATPESRESEKNLPDNIRLDEVESGVVSMLAAMNFIAPLVKHIPRIENAGYPMKANRMLESVLPSCVLVGISIETIFAEENKRLQDAIRKSEKNRVRFVCV